MYPSISTVEQYHEWLVPHLRAWARHGIHFGVSCTQRSLHRYIPYIRTACVNGIPSGETGLPEESDLVVALSCDVMWYRYPHRHHDVAKRGERNPEFLDATVLRDQVLPMIRAARPDVQMIMLPVAPIYATEHVSAAAFLDLLNCCLEVLPTDYRYAVEIGNPQYLLPEYFDCLSKHHVTHVLNDCAPSAGLLEQIQLPRVLTTDTVVVRIEETPEPETQLGIIETVRRCIDGKKTLYLYLRDSGDVLVSLAGLMDLLNPDLATLSPLRNKAA
jgi:DNA-directed RNA polymerase subunit H (RpoH/RPB5)